MKTDLCNLFSTFAISQLTWHAIIEQCHHAPCCYAFAPLVNFTD